MTQLRMPRQSARQKLRTEAKAADNIIHRNDLYSFLSECIRWGVGPNKVLDEIRVPNNNRLRKWRENMAAAGIHIKIDGVATWIEVNAANINDDVPAEWNAPPVVVDAQADPPTTRPRKWIELHKFHARVIAGITRYFVPCSDGRDYFDPDQVDAVKVDAAVVAELKPEDVPEADAA